MKKQISRIVVMLLSFAALAQSASSVSAISGVVVDSSGRRIPGGTLSYTKLDEYTRDSDGRIIVKQPGYGATVTSDANGVFTLLGLPAGRYHFCGKAFQLNQVSDCVWRGIPVVTLSAGQNVGGLNVTILDATTLTLQINDPNGRIAVPDAYGKVTPERRFFVGVSAGAYYVRAERVLTSTTQHTFKVVVPKQLPVHLFIDTDFTVIDSAGSVLETKRPTTSEILPGNADQLLVTATIK